VVDDIPEADLVVLDDAALGFRDQPDLWLKAITAGEREAWIVLKMAQAVGRRCNRGSRRLSVVAGLTK
jgi:hypothetical protein